MMGGDLVGGGGHFERGVRQLKLELCPSCSPWAREAHVLLFSQPGGGQRPASTGQTHRTACRWVGKSNAGVQDQESRVPAEISHILQHQLCQQCFPTWLDLGVGVGKWRYVSVSLKPRTPQQQVLLSYSSLVPQHDMHVLNARCTEYSWGDELADAQGLFQCRSTLMPSICPTCKL